MENHGDDFRKFMNLQYVYCIYLHRRQSAHRFDGDEARVYSEEQKQLLISTLSEYKYPNQRDALERGSLVREWSNT